MADPGRTLRGLAQRLDREGGCQLWRSVEELADTAAGRAAIAAEFPALAPTLGETSRRDVLRVMAASLALAGLSGCDPVQPEEKALPFVDAPEFQAPGEPLLYATATLLDGYAIPVLVKTTMGRPIKVEGNPRHPLTKGGTDIFAQAAVLDLYDRDRSKATTYLGQILTWGRLQRALIEQARELERRRGEGLAILSGTITSPTAVRQMRQLQERFPKMRLFEHEPVGSARRRDATRSAFGRPLEVHYRLDRVEVALSLEEDFLGPGPSQIVNAHRFAEGRRDALDQGRLLRLYAAESTPSLTGANATEHKPMAAAEVELLVLALAQRFGVGPAEAVDLPLERRAWLLKVAVELQQAGENALLAVGPHLPPDLQALGFQINRALGSLGETVELAEPAYWSPEDAGSLADLAEAIRGGAVDTLLMLDVNPLYTAPADLVFQDAVRQVPLCIHLGRHDDETAAFSHWHVPLAHPFESWSDARAIDGTATVLQPLIRPPYGGRTVHEVLATVAGEPDLTPYETVRRTWREILGADEFEEKWAQIVHDGFAPGTASRPLTLMPQALEVRGPQPAGTALEVVFRPDPAIWDGRFANNPWLQELPKPLSKLTWDNVAAISPELAAERRLRSGDKVRLSARDRFLEAPVWVLPGQAARTITLYLGYGRRRIGAVADGIGYDAYRLRRSDAPWQLVGVEMQAIGDEALLATTQLHHTMAGHDLVRKTTPAEVAAGQRVGPPPSEHSLYPEWEYPGYAWGMVIDLDACIGCNACVVACMAENNVPVVGKEQVAMGREMHWLRVDTYYEGDPSDPRTHFQPVPCMHCEKAPCEIGCPVNATVHGPEGLNQMIYNRCVGTRTCASYCPYKVRHFNFFDYASAELQLSGERVADDGRVAQRNPEVTVRARGVMEKCTYCVQRISRARIEAKKARRRIQDGEVVTACQAACPTRAIVFGDLNDRGSAVRRAKDSPRNYTLLQELGTRPRTTYLAKLVPPGQRRTRKG
jgi:MoCo/4Fe-4S cofactor protein with predicted Tat translocation signal